MSFTGQKPRKATQKECDAHWNGREGNFRCYLCGYTFKLGDVWRWVYGSRAKVMNCMVCEACDGDDVLDRWVAANKELAQRFWWAIRHD